MERFDLFDGDGFVVVTVRDVEDVDDDLLSLMGQPGVGYPELGPVHRLSLRVANSGCVTLTQFGPKSPISSTWCAASLRDASRNCDRIEGLMPCVCDSAGSDSGASALSRAEDYVLGVTSSSMGAAAGVDSVPELAQRNVASRVTKLAQVDGDKHLVRQLPSEATVAGRIEHAKTLPKPVTH